MSDAIFVNGLVLHAFHGVMPHEAKVGQPFTLDLVLDIDFTEAARTDNLKHTVSYEEVRGIRITVRKPHAPIAATFDDVGVIVERARTDRGRDPKDG
jgi:7,8-dihydroneopterin aldolase/epimerase/oxygenase